MPGQAGKDQYFNNSLARGLKTLSAFSAERPSLTVSEIAVAIALPQSTVFRLVTTLEQLGYLVRDEDTKRYRHSARMLTLGLTALESLDLRHVALPAMRALSECTHETVKLAILDGVEIVFLASVVAPEKLSMPTPAGHRLPAYCTPLGKALLAFQPIDQWEGLLRRIDFKPRTSKTITDPARFKAELQRTRKRGYALGNEELISGESSIAAPVLDRHGVALAAVNVSTLCYDLKQHSLTKQLIQATTACAQQICRDLGADQ
jgi:IclR family pca regulon transcriptional regulator